VNSYAEPSLSLNLVRFECDGKLFLAIEVPEFSDIPVVCSRDGRDLAAGAVYIRPAGKAETRPPRDAYELRELLILAAQKGTRRFIEEMRTVGVLRPMSLDLSPTASDKFGEQLGFLDEGESMTPLPVSVREDAHWEVIVRPSSFDPALLKTLGECQKVVEDSRVTLRGWDYPHVNRNNSTRGKDSHATCCKIRHLSQRWPSLLLLM